MIKDMMGSLNGGATIIVTPSIVVNIGGHDYQKKEAVPLAIEDDKKSQS